MKPKEFHDQIDHDKVVAAIGRAEAKSAGQVRVFITHKKPDDVVAAARGQFVRLKMHKTAGRNGVLIFFAPRVKGLAVIGDEAVHQRCGDEWWRKLVDEMTGLCKAGDFTGAIVHGVERTGAVLAEHFPRTGDSKNELADEVGED